MRQFDLQRIRIEKNLTQKKVAELTGYPQGFVSVIERGKASAPEAFINKVCEVFGVDNKDDYVKEVANITIRKTKNAKSSKDSTDISEKKTSPVADPVVSMVGSPEQSLYSRFLDLLEKKERKIESLEREIERLKSENLDLKLHKLQ